VVTNPSAPGFNLCVAVNAPGSPVYPYVTIVDHPLANGNPAAILIVTPNTGNSSSSGILGLLAVTSVFYDDAWTCGPANRWWMNGAALSSQLMSNNKFNVLITLP